ncbi:hypothetical protein TVAG_360130 [Trichomonas vaginalis G3]|uniref:TmcB/TmcC TPR repeats domain-containing protein n=1 Tax=Trichomonas vaginalis (strain ATCC PRA-98 / G3) TaxID=412133 RepID=A2DTD2_TRIV3|nr:guanylate cyclase protein [Trichomonas vaginalis G3]EAY16404.1 hypothetical protein TVAG_360130 [Trichomonas vaginalis G3]KAI5488368.1 guanylate cyclase protein [Trichomonas vaginalis G3]|eukprot:XP_001328627.1 hypothetical protein [Trichomonas vaginalis G3]
MAGFTQTIWNSVLTAASIVAIISTIVAWIYDYKQKAYPVIIIFCLVLIFFVLIGIVQIINNYLTVKAFTLLDEYYENKSLYQENQPGFMKCYFMATRGLVCAHPSVIGCDHMHNMLQLYPKNVNAWVFFARMLAAFPEENNKLLWVDDQIRHLHAHSIYMSHLKAQIMFLARSRETAMTHTLKKKVNTLQKDIQSTKNKLRHFWECVIQGNTDDLEIASAAARKSVEKTESNINHLNRIYRNNQYVARLYSRFLIHVKGNRIAYNEWHSNIEKLKNGQTIVPDYAQMDTIQLFPLILNSTTQQSNTEMIGGLFGESTSMPSISSSSCHVIDNDEEENNLLLTIKNSVTTMSIPSIRKSIIMITIVSLLICVLFFPIMVTIFVTLSTKSFSKIAIISNCSQINTDITHMVILSLSNLVQSAEYYPTFPKYLLKLYMEQNATSMGGLTDQPSMLKYIIADSGDMITNIRKLNDMMDESEELAKAQALLFQNVLSVETSRSLGGAGTGRGGGSGGRNSTRPGGNSTRPSGNWNSRNQWVTNNYSAETLIVSLGLDASTLVDTMNESEAKEYLQSSTLGNNNRFLAAI